MEITCRKCHSGLTIDNAATPIFKCTHCGYPNPVMQSGGQTAPVIPPKPALSQPATERQESKPTGMELGWLVVHDENAEQQTYPLRVGKQVIGRKSVSRPCDIMIETSDPFMGRNHCILEVKPSRSGGYDFFISDVKLTNGVPEQMSTNGTFVNAYPTPLKPKDMVYLNDGDTIQMGKTKLVIKTLISSASAQDASRVVQEMEYAPTVILK